MSNEVNEEVVKIKEEILEIKEELSKLNNLFTDVIKELKINSSMQIEDKESRELESILNNCLDEY